MQQDTMSIDKDIYLDEWRGVYLVIMNRCRKVLVQVICQSLLLFL